MQPAENPKLTMANIIVNYLNQNKKILLLFSIFKDSFISSPNCYHKILVYRGFFIFPDMQIEK